MDALIGLLVVALLAIASASSRKGRARRGGAPRVPYAPNADEARPEPIAQGRQVEIAEMMRSEAEAKPAPARSTPTEKAKAASATPREGSVSTQGESEAEHAAHMKPILAAEAARAQADDAARKLRGADLERLREAVVMSEVLDRPVSLRPRGRRMF